MYPQEAFDTQALQDRQIQQVTSKDRADTQSLSSSFEMGV